MLTNARSLCSQLPISGDPSRYPRKEYQRSRPVMAQMVLEVRYSRLAQRSDTFSLLTFETGSNKP